MAYERRCASFFSPHAVLVFLTFQEAEIVDGAAVYMAAC